MNAIPAIVRLKAGPKPKLTLAQIEVLAKRWNSADANRRALAREFGMSASGARAAVLRYLKERQAEGPNTTSDTLPPLDQSPAVLLTLEDGTCPDAEGIGSLAA